MEHPEQLIIVQKLLNALQEANFWAHSVPHSTIRELSPKLISTLCNQLKDINQYSKSVRTLCFEENLFQNEDTEGGE